MNSIHERLVELLNSELSSHLEGEPEFLYDGIKANIKTGIKLQIIYPETDEYIFAWEKDTVSYRIDTAPVHMNLDTAPNHFHVGDEVKNDELTSLKKSPEDNLKSVMAFIVG
jgi:hypothetical protein